jgi:spore germination protein GerM
MSVRKTGKGAANGGKKRKSMIAVLFWLVFLIVTLLLFIIKLPLIRSTLKSTHIVERLTNSPISGKTGDETPASAVEEPPDGVISIDPPSGTTMPVAPDSPLDAGIQAEAESGAEPAGVEPETPAELAPKNTNGASAESRPAVRERVIYFVKIDNSGLVFTSPVKRRVNVSDSPLLDALNLMLQGPTETEQAQGFTSLIPEGVRIQNVRVNGNTAMISFNENFMFNNYGAEGYIAQLRQIVWTATEFPNVKDVQVLIEGRRVDFLGESIRINRPISRDSL